MTPDYERLEDLVSRFPWIARNIAKYEHVWSADRNEIDPDFYFDSVLRDFGNEVKFDKIFTYDKNCLAITMGEWLYFGSKEGLEDHSTTVLLRRIKWSEIEISDVEGDVTILTVHYKSEES